MEEEEKKEYEKGSPEYNDAVEQLSRLADILKEDKNIKR